MQPPVTRARIALICSALATALFIITGPAPTRTGGFILMVIAIGAYAALLFILRRTPVINARSIIAVAAMLMVVAVAVKPQSSYDLYAYGMYGRMVSHYHANPYVHGPGEYPNEPLVHQLTPEWFGTKSVYGPGFTAMSAVVMVPFRSPLPTRLVFQTLAALAMLAACLIVWRRTRDPFAVALIGINPVVAASIVNGGHNDALVGLAVLGGVLLVDAGQRVRGGIALALGALIKVVGLLPLVAVTWWVARKHGPRAAARVAIPGGVLFAAGYLIAGPRAALSALSDAAKYVSRWSIASAARAVVDPSIRRSARSHSVSTAATIAVLVLATVLIVLYARRASLAHVAGLSLLGYLLAGAYVLPWYIAWALPVVAIVARSRAASICAWLGALLLLLYWPTRGAYPGTFGGAVGVFSEWVMPVLELLAIGALLVQRNARKAPENPEPSDAALTQLVD